MILPQRTCNEDLSGSALETRNMVKEIYASFLHRRPRLIPLNPTHFIQIKKSHHFLHEICDFFLPEY